MASGGTRDHNGAPAGRAKAALHTRVQAECLHVLEQQLATQSSQEEILRSCVTCLETILPDGEAGSEAQRSAGLRDAEHLVIHLKIMETKHDALLPKLQRLAEAFANSLRPARRSPSLDGSHSVSPSDTLGVSASYSTQMAERVHQLTEELADFTKLQWEAVESLGKQLKAVVAASPLSTPQRLSDSPQSWGARDERGVAGVTRFARQLLDVVVTKRRLIRTCATMLSRIQVPPPTHTGGGAHAAGGAARSEWPIPSPSSVRTDVDAAESVARRLVEEEVCDQRVREEAESRRHAMQWLRDQQHSAAGGGTSGAVTESVGNVSMYTERRSLSKELRYAAAGGPRDGSDHPSPESFGRTRHLFVRSPTSMLGLSTSPARGGSPGDLASVCHSSPPSHAPHLVPHEESHERRTRNERVHGEVVGASGSPWRGASTTEDDGDPFPSLSPPSSSPSPTPSPPAAPCEVAPERSAALAPAAVHDTLGSATSMRKVPEARVDPGVGRAARPTLAPSSAATRSPGGDSGGWSPVRSCAPPTGGPHGNTLLTKEQFHTRLLAAEKVIAQHTATVGGLQQDIRRLETERGALLADKQEWKLLESELRTTIRQKDLQIRELRRALSESEDAILALQRDAQDLKKRLLLAMAPTPQRRSVPHLPPAPARGDSASSDNASQSSRSSTQPLSEYAPRDRGTAGVGDLDPPPPLPAAQVHQWGHHMLSSPASRDVVAAGAGPRASAALQSRRGRLLEQVEQLRRNDPHAAPTADAPCGEESRRLPFEALSPRSGYQAAATNDAGSSSSGTAPLGDVARVLHNARNLLQSIRQHRRGGDHAELVGPVPVVANLSRDQESASRRKVDVEPIDVNMSPCASLSYSAAKEVTRHRGSEPSRGETPTSPTAPSGATAVAARRREKVDADRHSHRSCSTTSSARDDLLSELREQLLQLQREQVSVHEQAAQINEKREAAVQQLQGQLRALIAVGRSEQTAKLVSQANVVMSKFDSVRRNVEASGMALAQKIQLVQRQIDTLESDLL